MGDFNSTVGGQLSPALTSGQADNGDYIMLKHVAGFSENKWWFYIYKPSIGLIETGVSIDGSDSDYISERLQKYQWIAFSDSVYIFDKTSVLNLKTKSYYKVGVKYEWSHGNLYSYNDNNGASSSKMIIYAAHKNTLGNVVCRIPQKDFESVSS